MENTTPYYSYTEFELPPAEFNDIYADYGEDTDDEDGLYDYLVVDVGVNVIEAGDYRVSGYLYENGTYNDVDYDSNTTYLNEGNQTIQLKFEGIKIRNNEYNGTYDLKSLYLYNYSSPIPPPPPPTPTPTPISARFSQPESKSIETENISVGYGEQLDYRYYAYTTSYYNYTDFQEGGIIAGRVTYENGTGIYNTYVYASGLSYEYDYTNETGYYSIVGLEAGNYTVTAYPPYGTNLIPNSTTATVIVGETTTLNFVLYSPPKISNISITPRYPKVNTTIQR